MVRVAVLVSGGGTNLQKLLEAESEGGNPHGKIELVVSSVVGAYALERATNFGVPAVVLEPTQKGLDKQFNKKLLSVLIQNKIDVVVLAGFLAFLDESVIKAFPNRIINVHPSLIPAFCGAGFYGLKVHRAALKRGVKVSGATVHLVNEEIDGGKILLQKAVEVHPDDTPNTLQERIMKEAEWVILPLAVAELCKSIAETNGG